MNETKHATITGVIVFFCLLIVVVGGIWLSGTSFLRNEYIIYIRFDDVNGLSKGSVINLKGINIGKVTDILIKPEGAQVEASIQKQYQIPKDSKFLLVSNLMDKAININMGSLEEYLKDGDLVFGLQRDIYETFFDVSQSGKKAIESLFSPENIAAYTLTIREMSKTVEELRKMIMENRKSLAVVLQNVEETSKNINVLFRDNSQDIQIMVKELARSGQTAARMVARSDSLLKDLSTITNRIETGQGTLGKLVTQDSLYNDLKETTSNMKKLSVHLNTLSVRSESLIVNTDSLVGDIKKNPKKYLKVSVF